MIISSTSTPQIHSICIPLDKTKVPQQLLSYRRFCLALAVGDICLNVTITCTTADSQGGQEKPALQETWEWLRQQQLPQKAPILQVLNWRGSNTTNTVDQGNNCYLLYFSLFEIDVAKTATIPTTHWCIFCFIIVWPDSVYVKSNRQF